ncbi:MAG: pantoate--beta-alanine ligase [Desulfobacteraceae bacterium]|nr:pantoate--beta-alanine ligase [Desulfobacteraceae bacterium]
MRIIETIAEMQQAADNWRAHGERIGFVPTMGFLHKGHLDLMRTARRLSSQVVISIFVNPTQFAPHEDFDSYPRDMQRDLDFAREVGVDAVFTPNLHEMYPEGFQTYVTVTEVSKNLCGRSRPVFFRGVATVVSKLFHAVKPHLSVFGEKDFQQLVTIRRMVRDMNMDVEIIGHPIVREEDGLAMSSRNAYLRPEERPVALRLGRALALAQDLVSSGERQVDAILGKVSEFIAGDGAAKIDYAQICDPNTLEDIAHIGGPALLALAVWVGKTRLIDNRILQPSG